MRSRSPKAVARGAKSGKSVAKREHATRIKRPQNPTSKNPALTPKPQISHPLTLQVTRPPVPLRPIAQHASTKSSAENWITPRVLMFGWEFPPVMNGGLGTACRDLVVGLTRLGASITYVMPHDVSSISHEGARFVGVEHRIAKLRRVPSPLTGYMTSGEYAMRGARGKGQLYGRDLYDEVWRFGAVAGAIALEEVHDVIHAHDWMTYPAAISAKRASGKPLVVHIHNTSFDRTAGHPSKAEYDIELHGFREADRIIAISNRVKQTILDNYGIPSEKIDVVHWGIEEDRPEYHLDYKAPYAEKHKLVLFLGRVTIQKGPDYFVEAAKRVLEVDPSVRFVIAGDGDMLPRVINRAVDLGISDKVVFTGALRGADVHRAFQTADVFVMPSVSEPFGLVALEALKNNTPIIISKTSGVSEVVRHCLVVDFWDVDALAAKILSVLEYKELQQELRENGHREAATLDRTTPGRKTLAAYAKVMLA